MLQFIDNLIEWQAHIQIHHKLDKFHLIMKI